MDRSEEICPHGLYGHKYIQEREIEREDGRRRETFTPPAKEPSRVIRETIYVSTQDPRNFFKFEIIKIKQVCENVVVKIRYQDHTVFKGVKICIFRKTTCADINALESIDPNISDKNKVSPFALFEPTKKGWEAAMSLAGQIT